MNFCFTVEELSFIVKHFKYKDLIGFKPQKCKEKNVAQPLEQKGYLRNNNGKYELPNELRLLFSAWLQVRYTVVREDYWDDENVFSIMASPKYIISYSEHNDDINIAICDFSFETMDCILADYLGLSNIAANCSGYNYTFATSDFIDFFGENRIDSVSASKKTGLSEKCINEIVEYISFDDSISLIMQDVEKNIGAMAVIKYIENSLFMVKHIVPNDDLLKQKVVVVKGDAESIVNSIYVL